MQTCALGFLLAVGPAGVWDVSIRWWRVQTKGCLRAWVSLAESKEANWLLICCSREIQTAPTSSPLCCLLMVLLGTFFLLTQSPLFPVCYNLPSITTSFPVSLSPLPVCWVAFPLPVQAGGEGLPAAACSSCREGCSAQHRANGAEEEPQHRRHRPNPSPACGYCRRVSTVAGWGGEESQAAVFTDSRRLCKCCVSVAGHEAWGVLESCASLLLLPCRLSSAFPI